MFRLFFLNVYATNLELTENAYNETEEADLLVRVNFLHLPTLQMVESDRAITHDYYHYDFNSGQCLHFSMKHEELLKSMKQSYLKIGVFRENESFPLFSISLKLSGCVCNLISKAVSESRPFMFKGPFDLVDSGRTPAGQIHLDVYLTSLGRYTITQYALRADHFLVKKERCGAEYMCELKERGEREESPLGSPVDGDIENFIQDIAGISSVAARLALGKPTKSTRILQELTEEAKKSSAKKGKKKKKKKKKKKEKKKKK